MIHARAVQRLLTNLNISKSTGLVLCSSMLACPLANIFSALYHAGIFPYCRKIAYVASIPIKGKAHNPKDNRTITRCSAVSKVMESMVSVGPVLMVTCRCCSQRNGTGLVDKEHVCGCRYF